MRHVKRMTVGRPAPAADGLLYRVLIGLLVEVEMRKTHKASG